MTEKQDRGVVTPEDMDMANKAFDVAFRGDTVGIDSVMAGLFARHRLASQADQGVIHPDRLGHAADAIQDACRIHLGAIIRSDGASKIARYVLAHIDKMNAEYATHPQPQPSKGEGA